MYKIVLQKSNSQCNVLVYRLYMCAGESVILRHVRNGIELVPIDQNLYYDFNYQVTNHITPRVVLPVSTILYVLYN